MQYFEYKRYERDEKSESRTAEKGAKKLVSSDVLKILENENIAIKIEKLVRKQCLFPLIQLKLQILLLLLSNRMLLNCQCEFSDIRLSDCQQKFSDICSPDHKQRFSDRKGKMANNQNDA
jgi:hypothetical protein